MEDNREIRMCIFAKDVTQAPLAKVLGPQAQILFIYLFTLFKYTVLPYPPGDWIRYRRMYHSGEVHVERHLWDRYIKFINP